MIRYALRSATLAGLVASLSLCSAPHACAGPGAAFLDPLAFTSLGVFNPNANVVVDVQSGQMSGGAIFTGVRTTQAGVTLLVFNFSSFTVSSGLSITVTNFNGNDALAFLSQGGMTINGVIDAGGGAGSAGMFGSGAGSGANGTTNSSGGDGGGGGGFGGMGGSGEGGIAGGATYNSDLTAQLGAGSGGGTGGGSAGGSGGSGGSALQIVALGYLTVTGTVSVDGGTGVIGQLSGSEPGGSGGGGSGGGLLVEAANVTVTDGAVLSADGGDGGPSYALPLGYFNFGGGGGGGGGGLIVVAYAGSAISSGSITASGGDSGYGFSGGGNPGMVTFLQSTLVPALPAIAASRDSSGNIILSWPSSATNFVLQSSGALGPGADWKTVTGAMVIGNNFVSTNQIVGAAGFFRLELQ